MASWSVETARSVADGVVLVVPAGGPGTDRSKVSTLWSTRAPVGTSVPTSTVIGGATRAESVRAGLGVVPDDAGVIVVHDAVRPLASASLFEAVVEAVGAAPPAPFRWCRWRTP